MKVGYVPFREEYREDLLKMIKALYAFDPAGCKMNTEKIEKTISFLTNHPEHGKIILLASDGKIIGYSIIVYYWSNEYGGFILLLDELFVKEEYRSKGVGSDFIKHLISNESVTCKAIFLEVIPTNERALEFYNRIGFVPVGHNFRKYLLSD